MSSTLTNRVSSESPTGSPGGPAAVTAAPPSASLGMLCEQIESANRFHLRKELPRIRAAIEEARISQTTSRQQLESLAYTFEMLHIELVRYFLVVNRLLLPRIRHASDTLTASDSVVCFVYSQQAVIRLWLHRLRRATNDFQAPVRSKPSYRQVINNLASLWRTMHTQLQCQEEQLLAPLMATITLCPDNEPADQRKAAHVGSSAFPLTHIARGDE